MNEHKSNNPLRSLDEIADEYHRIEQSERGNIFAKGKLLAEAKDQCEDGRWLKWINDNFDLSYASAHRYLSAHKLAIRFCTVQNLEVPTRVIYCLAALLSEERDGDADGVAAAIEALSDATKGRTKIISVKEAIEVIDAFRDDQEDTGEPDGEADGEKESDEDEFGDEAEDESGTKASAGEEDVGEQSQGESKLARLEELEREVGRLQRVTEAQVSQIERLEAERNQLKAGGTEPENPDALYARCVDAWLALTDVQRRKFAQCHAREYLDPTKSKGAASENTAPAEMATA